MSAEPTHIDIPTAWGVPGYRVEVGFLRQVLDRHGYVLATKPAPDAFNSERAAFVRTAAIHITCVDRELTESQVIDEAMRMWDALQKAGC